ncbi:MAG: adenine methyltransferase [Stutzerimonas stutzeri]|nr:MAG: adenine methyltransferase [Stutzerimonas stutzeri]
MKKLGMGGHHSASSQTNTWLTPKHVIDELGPFDLDPCAAPDPKPWPTARVHYTWPEQDGLALPWGNLRCWVNPPYSSNEIGLWLRRLADHGRGSALIFARTETEAFHRFVWDRADACLFLEGRLFFHHADGTRASANAGAPSVLVAYGEEDVEKLMRSRLEGKFVALARPVLVQLVFREDPPMPGWNYVVTEALRTLGGTARLKDLYQALNNHPRAKSNPNWQAKIRQTVSRAGLRRVDNGVYSLAA